MQVMKTETYYEFVNGKLVETEDPMPKDGYDHTPLAKEDPDDEDGWPIYSIGSATSDVDTVFQYPKGADPSVEFIEAMLIVQGRIWGYFFITDEYTNDEAFEPTGRMFMANVTLY